MIGHIETGSDFGGLFRYLLASDKGARIIGRKCFGQTTRELSLEFTYCADQRRTTQKPVKHLMISFAPEDGFVEDETKTRIADKALERLGYTDNQYLIVDHQRDDPGHDWNHDHDHIHIVVNMVTIGGERINDHQDKRKFEAFLREQEKVENLTQVVPSWEKERRSPTHGQVQRYKREQKDYQAGLRDKPPEMPVSQKLQHLIDEATREQSTMTQFVARLQHQGVEVRPKITRNNIVQGISYCLDEVQFPGSRLRNCSFPKLQKERGVDYEAERDLPALKKAAAGEIVELDTSDELEQKTYQAREKLDEIRGQTEQYQMQKQRRKSKQKQLEL